MKQIVKGVFSVSMEFRKNQGCHQIGRDQVFISKYFKKEDRLNEKDNNYFDLCFVIYYF
jgi:hypothetical protein